MEIASFFYFFSFLSLFHSINNLIEFDWIWSNFPLSSYLYLFIGRVSSHFRYSNSTSFRLFTAHKLIWIFFSSQRFLRYYVFFVWFCPINFGQNEANVCCLSNFLCLIVDDYSWWFAWRHSLKRSTNALFNDVRYARSKRSASMGYWSAVPYIDCGSLNTCAKFQLQNTK